MIWPNMCFRWRYIDCFVWPPLDLSLSAVLLRRNLTDALDAVTLRTKCACPFEAIDLVEKGKSRYLRRRKMLQQMAQVKKGITSRNLRRSYYYQRGVEWDPMVSCSLTKLAGGLLLLLDNIYILCSISSDGVPRKRSPIPRLGLYWAIVATVKAYAAATVVDCLGLCYVRSYKVGQLSTWHLQ